MQLSFLFKGMVIGFLISTPVGALGVLCIRRTLTQGRLVGLVSGSGAAAADAFYALLAASGVTVVSGILIRQQVWLRLVAAVVLLYLGTRVFRAHPALPADPPRVLSLMGDFASTFLLALSNPMIILSLAAIFAGFGLTLADGSRLSIVLLAAGVFCGSALWWVILSVAVTVFRLRLGEEDLRWINRIAGSVILLFALLILLSLGFWRP